MSKVKNTLVIDFMGLCGIGLYCLCASLFESSFAKIHLTLPFLDFPLFVGEMLLLLTVVLFGIKYFVFKERVDVRLWVVYALIVLIYILIGYVQWGPLALRNGAMFLYGFFALATYYFSSSHIVQSAMIKWVALVFITAVLMLQLVGDYYWYTYIILFTVLIINKLPKKYAWFIPLFLVFLQLNIIFSGARAHLMGLLTAVIYLTVIAVFIFNKISKRWRWGIIIAIFICFFLIGIKKEPNAIKSMTDFRTLEKLYLDYASIAQEKRQVYQPPQIESKLYNPHYHENKALERAGYTMKAPWRQGLIISPNIAHHNSIEWRKMLNHNDATKDASWIFIKAKDSISMENVKTTSKINDDHTRNLSVAYHNSLFRIFIWQDMLGEWMGSNIIFGVGLGKPQRSASIEVLGWAYTEWNRDGWIAPHNSFLHIVYRVGVFGLIIIFLLFKIMWDLTKIFIHRKNIYGILLLSILVYLAVMAIFSVILEVPYFAIFFWSLLGVIYGYGYPKGSRIR